MYRIKHLSATCKKEEVLRTGLPPFLFERFETLFIFGERKSSLNI